MANDCLVTKLKGVVQNENLEKLGFISLPALSYNYELCVGASKAGVIVSSELPFVGSQDTSILASYPATDYFSSSVVTVPANSKVSISNKYDLTVLINQYFDSDMPLRISDLNFIDFIFLSFAYEGYITDLKRVVSSVKRFNGRLNVRDTDNFGEFLNKMPNIEVMWLYSSSGATTTFDIASVGVLTSIKEIGFDYIDVYGNIEQLVKNQVNNGRTAFASLKITLSQSEQKVKFGGEYVPLATGEKILSWSPNATAGRTNVTYDGTTIVIDNTTGEIVG